MNVDYKIIKLADVLSPRQFGIDEKSFDYTIVARYVDKIKKWMSDEWKYGSNIIERKQLQRYVNELNKVLVKYNKKIE